MGKLKDLHGLSDAQWAKIEPIIKARLGARMGVRGNSTDIRTFVNACLGIVKANAFWSELPPQYGDFKTMKNRCQRWRDSGHWDLILLELINEPDFKWLRQKIFNNLDKKRFKGCKKDLCSPTLIDCLCHLNPYT